MAVLLACLLLVSLLGVTFGTMPAWGQEKSVAQQVESSSPFHLTAVRGNRKVTRRPTTAKPAATAVEPAPAAQPAAAAPVVVAEPAKPEPPAPPVKLVHAARETELRRFLPKVADSDVQAMLDDPRLVFYTDQEIPKAYQFFDGAFPGVHAVSYNISANNSEPFGNGNIEFPWGTPAGTHRSPGVTTFRFFLLPKDENGQTRPVAWFQPPDGSYSWIFPIGTVFGEVLGVPGSDGKNYTFELRTRRRETGDWTVDVFRPFPTSAHLVDRIKELAPEWKSRDNLVKFISHLEGPQKLPVLVLADQQPAGRPFVQQAGVDTLPSLEDDALVAKLLLTTTFRSAHGKVWRRGSDGVTTAAPTTQASFHVVPKYYDAGFVEVDQVSCMRCHSTVSKSVDNFNSGRDWYGKVRGSDGIFSFHPFEPSSISYHGYSQQVQMRGEFVKGKLLERFDPARHPNRVYHTLVR